MRIFHSSYNCSQASVNRLQHVGEVFSKITIDVVNERTSNTEKQMLFVIADGACNSGLIHGHYFPVNYLFIINYCCYSNAFY